MDEFRYPDRRASSPVRCASAMLKARQFVIFFYLWALFGLFVLNEPRRPHPWRYGGVSGLRCHRLLVMAKVMLLAELFDVYRGIGRSSVDLVRRRATPCSSSPSMRWAGARRRLSRRKRLLEHAPSFGGGGLAGLPDRHWRSPSSRFCPSSPSNVMARIIGPDRMKAILFTSRRPAGPAAR